MRKAIIKKGKNEALILKDSSSGGNGGKIIILDRSQTSMVGEGEEWEYEMIKILDRCKIAKVIDRIDRYLVDYDTGQIEIWSGDVKIKELNDEVPADVPDQIKKEASHRKEASMALAAVMGFDWKEWIMEYAYGVYLQRKKEREARDILWQKILAIRETRRGVSYRVIRDNFLITPDCIKEFDKKEIEYDPHCESDDGRRRGEWVDSFDDLREIDPKNAPVEIQEIQETMISAQKMIEEEMELEDKMKEIKESLYDLPFENKHCEIDRALGGGLAEGTHHKIDILCEKTF